MAHQVLPQADGDKTKEDEEEEQAVSVHGEKLTIAFGALENELRGCHYRHQEAAQSMQ